MVSRETRRARGFDNVVHDALVSLEADGLLRTPLVAEAAGGPVIRIAGREVINLCSNDYLGLSVHPAITRALRSAQPNHGAGASRHIGGTDASHRRLEQALADFVDLPRALLFSSGYAANVGAIQALVGPDDVIFSDELNNASIIDGCRLSRATVHVYPHHDVATLASLLAAHRASHRAAVVVSESIFSMDGDIAPLPDLRAVASQYQAGLLVDEAHALGVLGPEGRGLLAELGHKADVVVATLGKAFGCAGAFVAASAEIIALIENRARSFVYSTATPPSATAGPLAAIPLVRAASEQRTRVLRAVGRLRNHLSALGHAVPCEVSHILPVRLGPPDVAITFASALLERGVFVHAIRPPTVPRGASRLRITASAGHTDEQIDTAISVFSSIT